MAGGFKILHARRLATLAISGTPSTSATQGVAYTTFTPVVTGGFGTVTFALTGSRPSGMAFSTVTGALSGTPNAAGVFSGLIITATDGLGRTASLAAFAITVAAAVTAGFGNDGTQVVPGGAISVTTATLSAAINARGTNTVLSLAPGDYGTWNFNASDYNGLKLIGQQGVLFDHLLVTGSNLTLSYMDLYRGQNNATIVAGQFGILINANSNVTIDHIGMRQGDVYAARCTGIFIRNSHDITVQHCDLFKVGNGIAGQGDNGLGTDCYNISVLNNSISNYVENGIFFQNVGNVRISGNRVRNYDLSSGGHADICQLTSITKQGSGLLDATTGNSYACIMERNYGEVVDGFTDPSGFGGQIDTITGGLCMRQVCSFGSSFQGIGAGRLTGGASLIDDCFSQGRVDTFGTSRYLIRSQSDNVTVQGCQSNHYDTTDTPAPTNLTPPIAQWNQSTPPTGNLLIPAAVNGADRSLVDPWLAARTTVPHW